MIGDTFFTSCFCGLLLGHRYLNANVDQALNLTFEVDCLRSKQVIEDGPQYMRRFDLVLTTPSALVCAQHSFGMKALLSLLRQYQVRAFALSPLLITLGPCTSVACAKGLL